MAKNNCLEAMVEHSNLRKDLKSLSLLAAGNDTLNCLEDAPALNALPSS